MWLHLDSHPSDTLRRWGGVTQGSKVGGRGWSLLEQFQQRPWSGSSGGGGAPALEEAVDPDEGRGLMSGVVVRVLDQDLGVPGLGPGDRGGSRLRVGSEAQGGH